MTFETDVTALYRQMYHFGLRLTHNEERAADLTHDTIVKALENQHRFEPGTNLRAWLFTIMRNKLYSDIRRAGMQSRNLERIAFNSVTEPAQQTSLELKEALAVIESMPEIHREAIVLSSLGEDMETIAKVCDIPLGTVKSRVHRARERLEGTMEGRIYRHRRSSHIQPG